jgi:endogenous inhibitor of DNA gyrase (YacG/DUF329 family)
MIAARYRHEDYEIFVHVPDVMSGSGAKPFCTMRKHGIFLDHISWTDEEKRFATVALAQAANESDSPYSSECKKLKLNMS